MTVWKPPPNLFLTKEGTHVYCAKVRTFAQAPLSPCQGERGRGLGVYLPSARSIGANKTNGAAYVYAARSGFLPHPSYRQATGESRCGRRRPQQEREVAIQHCLPFPLLNTLDSLHEFFVRQDDWPKAPQRVNSFTRSFTRSFPRSPPAAGKLRRDSTLPLPAWHPANP